MAAIVTTTLYFRARWRTAPTVLNGTKPFHDADDAPERTVRMIRLNDIMGYADIPEWNAEVSNKLHLILYLYSYPQILYYNYNVTLELGTI